MEGECTRERMFVNETEQELTRKSERELIRLHES